MSLTTTEKSRLSSLQSQIRSKQNELVRMKESLDKKIKEANKIQSDINILMSKM